MDAWNWFLIGVVLGAALGFGAGAWLEWRYGKRAAEVNAALHARLDAMTATVQDVLSKLK